MANILSLKTVFSFMSYQSQAILDLQISVKDLQTESDYELRLKDLYCEGKIKALEENFSLEIDSLKTKYQV